MIQIKNILSDDVFGLWHIKKIVVKKDGQRFILTLDYERFATKDDAERHARVRVQRFLQRKLGLFARKKVCDSQAQQYAFFGIALFVAVNFPIVAGAAGGVA